MDPSQQWFQPPRSRLTQLHLGQETPASTLRLTACRTNDTSGTCTLCTSVAIYPRSVFCPSLSQMVPCDVSSAGGELHDGLTHQAWKVMSCSIAEMWNRWISLASTMSFLLAPGSSKAKVYRRSVTTTSHQLNYPTQRCF